MAGPMRGATVAMRRRWITRIAVAWALAASFAGGGWTALAQVGGAPPTVVAAIEDALQAGEAAAASAAMSAGIARTPARGEYVARTRSNVAQAALVEAVVSGIARHPEAVSAIVGVAVQRAPAYRDAIARSASLAFPGFAREIAAAAGTAYAPPAFAYTTPAAAYAPPAVAFTLTAPVAPARQRAPTVSAAPPAQPIRSSPFLFGSFLDGDETTAEPEPPPVLSDRNLDDGIYIVKPKYWIGYGENAWRIVASPLHYDRDDWITVAIIAGITGALIIADESLMDIWQNDVRSGVTDDAADIFELFGQEEMVYGLLGAYAAAEALGWKREKAATLMALESFALSGLLVAGLKWITGRERPNDTDTAYDFGGPGAAGTNASFPSGHTVVAFAVASVISDVYGDQTPAASWLAYTAATGAALARVNEEKHWVSDVVAAGAIGYFVGKLVTRFNPFLARHNIAVEPSAQDGAPGVALAYRF